MRVLYKYMRYVENKEYYSSLIVFNNKKGNNNVEFQSVMNGTI